MSGTLTRSNEHTMYRETPVSQLLTMRETGVSRDIFKGGTLFMAETLSASAQKVQDALHALGMDCQVVELPATTRSAKEAAQAIGCQVGQIVKSLVFRGQNSNTPILALVSGVNRVNEKKLSTLAAEPIQKADADFVREKTGFAIGGVPPIGHRETCVTFIDQDLFQYQELWAAAGTPHAVFHLTPEELKQIADGCIIDVA